MSRWTSNSECQLAAVRSEHRIPVTQLIQERRLCDVTRTLKQFCLSFRWLPDVEFQSGILFIYIFNEYILLISSVIMSFKTVTMRMQNDRDDIESACKSQHKDAGPQVVQTG